MAYTKLSNEPKRTKTTGTHQNEPKRDLNWRRQNEVKQGFHSILKLKIEENRGDFSKSMRNGALSIEAFNITVFL